MIKLYSSRHYLPPSVTSHSEILFPFWGESPTATEWADYPRFSAYIREGHSYFSLVDQPSDADYAVLPTDWKRYSRTDSTELAIRFVREMKEMGKQTLVFNLSDSQTPLPIPNALVFRTSLSASSKSANEYAMPPFTPDYIETFFAEHFPLREKHTKPSVGFCGNAQPRPQTWKRRILPLARHLGLYRAETEEHYLTLRKRVLNLLQRDPGLQTNFIIRDGYFGNALVQKQWDTTLLEQRRQEFLENLVNNDYNVVIRGSGNFSFRLYETLSCGRIPIFLNTDCLLPFEGLIRWKDYCVWIDYCDLELMPEIIRDYHATLTPSRFKEIQHECRKLWLEWFTPEGFFRHLSEQLAVTVKGRE